MQSAPYAPSLTVVALVIVLTACGGGSSRTGMPQPVAPPPQPVAPPQSGALLEDTTGWFANPDADDLADHWHITVAPGAIRDVLALSEPSENAAANLDTIARVVGRTSPANLQVLGRTQGYSVGRWVSGPADHTPVTLEWNIPDDEVADEFRAQGERAAKLWSHHLSEPYEGYTLPDGQITYGTHAVVGAFPEHAPLIARGYPTHRGCGEQPFPCKAQWLEDWTARDGSEYVRATTPASRRGEIWLHPRLPRNEIAHVSPGRLIAHELGHVFYLYTFAASNPSPVYTAPEWLASSAAVAVHGGPVPYRRLPNGGIDQTHWADSACPTLMAYGCPGEQVGPSELDVAFLKDKDYRVAESSVADAEEVYSLGAWGQYSAFQVSVGRDLDSYTDDRLRASASVYGIAPASAFASARASGTATWNGLLLGVDLGAAGLPPVTGDATVTFDLATLRGGARFTNLVVLSNGTRSPFRNPTLAYAVSATDNGFRDTDGYVQGAWYGSGHKEVAGTVLDRRSSVDLTAAFGASRSDRHDGQLRPRSSP